MMRAAQRSSRLKRMLRVSIAVSQARLATALGVSRARRTETVVVMLDSNARRAPGYWLQLFLATGIATLGLALGSTAVVIGGMLVSPLMGPLVELGMGFAVGSSLLVIRAFLRVAISAIVVTTAAALMTLALPFHEVTAEISARTAPTLLDLLVAVFCALAAAYTTVRRTADTTAAAAGTAIGIALVPPLCVVGYGLGTLSATVASGAGLLFIANFSAILLVTVVSFLVLGFNQVEAAAFEHDYLETSSTRTDRMAERAHLALRGVFGSRYGLAMRLLIPAIVLAVVAVPLKHALDEVAWEVRVRDGIRRILASESPRAVQSSFTVDRRSVAIRLLVVGSPELGIALQHRLSERITKVAGTAPTVTVAAVPDAAMLRATLASEARDVARSSASSKPSIDIAELNRQLASALDAAWPTPTAGPLLGWTLELTSNSGARVRVRHLGSLIGPSAEEMLARSLAVPLRAVVRVIDMPLPATELVASASGDSVWLARALSVLDELASVDSAVACVTRPSAGRSSSRRSRSASATRAVEALLRTSEVGHLGRLFVTDGNAWAIRVAPITCAGQSGTP
ncbi:MAG: DUF389 domain-containing protein [Gemmatimonadaceae bacterium]